MDNEWACIDFVSKYNPSGWLSIGGCVSLKKMCAWVLTHSHVGLPDPLVERILAMLSQPIRQSSLNVTQVSPNHELNGRLLSSSGADFSFLDHIVQPDSGISAVVATVRRRALNPGLCLTSDDTPCSASVNAAGREAGIVWVHQGVVVKGSYRSGSPYQMPLPPGYPPPTRTSFIEGDTIGLAVDSAERRVFCFINGDVVMCFGGDHVFPKQGQLKLGIHACSGDVMELVDPDLDVRLSELN
eukprot:TRINITY_DN6828_c0_g1_i1.p1 TRINITY_DN6828_c0_g1~~TRINITY_DN6828_c0_g1_i1.p1  ORF type:complete len:260 (+),score=55.56 TRINITY_DN6828_c0_g1_i1:56-781(+)